MKGEDFLYIILIAGMFGLFVTMLYFELTETVVEPIDYKDRFDRLELGIRNYAVDICFQWGGQWITDQNNLLEQDFDIPLADGSFRKGKVILCVKQPQEV